VTMAAYTPLLANLSQVTGHSRDRSLQWATNMIGYDALRAYGTPTYYVQKLFSEHRGDVVLESTGKAIPQWTTTDNKSFPSLHWVATRKAGEGGRPARIQLKIASRAATAQRLNVQLDGVKKPAASGLLTLIASDDPEAANTLDAPQRIVPRVLPVKGIGKTFSVELPAYSVGVLEFEAQ